MDLKTLLSTTPESLAQAQHDALQAHVLQVLDYWVRAIKDRKYGDDEIPATFASPAGDSYGLDNVCIDFAPPGVTTDMDISDVLTRLEELNKLARGN